MKNPPRSANAGRQDLGGNEQADYVIVFDGGSRGNPGFGYGSYLLKTRGGRQELRRLEFGDNQTNNEAEYRALICALQDLIERIETAGRHPREFSIRVQGDSALVINQIKGRWKLRHPRMRELCQQACHLLHRFGGWQIVQQPREDSVEVLGH